MEVDFFLKQSYSWQWEKYNGFLFFKIRSFFIELQRSKVINFSFHFHIVFSWLQTFHLFLFSPLSFHSSLSLSLSLSLCVCVRACACMRLCVYWLFLFIICPDWFCLMFDQLRLTCIFPCLALSRMNDVDVASLSFVVFDLREFPCLSQFVMLDLCESPCFSRFVIKILQKMFKFIFLNT